MAVSDGKTYLVFSAFVQIKIKNDQLYTSKRNTMLS